MSQRIPWLMVLAEHLVHDRCRTCADWPAVAIVGDGDVVPLSQCPDCGRYATQVIELVGVDVSGI